MSRERRDVGNQREDQDQLRRRSQLIRVRTAAVIPQSRQTVLVKHRYLAIFITEVQRKTLRDRKAFKAAINCQTNGKVE